MTDPATVMDAIGQDAADLDSYGKQLDNAVTQLNLAEAAWELIYDQFIEELTEDTAKKRLPGEDVRVALCRRRDDTNRQAWNNLRNAKRAVEKLEKQISAKRAALSGRQSELGALRDEAKASGFQPPQRPQAQPQWTQGVTRVGG